MNAEITRCGVFNMQVCVPADWTDEQVTEFANSSNPSGINSRWEIVKEGHRYLKGTHERVDCEDRPGMVHILLVV